MKALINTFSILIICLLALPSYSQGFEAQLIGGISAAQIRGDEIAGFNKVGIESGIRASYPIRYNMDLGLELLYSERGSRSNETETNNIGGDQLLFKFNYFSIPIMFSIKDWLYDAENKLSYYRIAAEAGVSYGRLLKSGVEGPLGPVNDPEFIDALNQSDVSWILGASYQINYRFGARFRYNRSLTKVFKAADNPNINYGDLLPFHLSLHLTYKL